MEQIRWGRGYWLASGPLVAGLLVSLAYGQTAGEKPPAGATPSPAPAAQASSPDKVVLKVGDMSITQEQIERAIRNLTPQAQNSLAHQGRKSFGDEYVLMLVLSQEALSQHLDSTPAYQDMIALSRLKILASQEYQEILKQVAVKPEEVSTYFSGHQSEFEELQVLQVVVRQKPAGAKEGTPGFTPEEAKARAEEIRKAFVAGDDPKQIADKYKMQNVVRVDTQPFAVHRGAMRGDLEKAAFELKPGGVTEVFDLGQALAFVKVVSHETEDLKSVSTRIENTLQKQKIDSALDALKKNAKVWMDDAYFAPPAGPPPQAPPKETIQIPVGPK